MSITNDETGRAIIFARDVSEAMLRLRGYRTPSAAPRAVRDDVFATIARHQDAYSKGFAGHSSPQSTAEAIQNAEWDRG
jgi:hypothetical protein